MKILQIYSGNVCTAPDCKFAVSMFSYYKCMNAAAVNTQGLSKMIFKETLNKSTVEKSKSIITIKTAVF